MKAAQSEMHRLQDRPKTSPGHKVNRNMETLLNRTVPRMGRVGVSPVGMSPRYDPVPSPTSSPTSSRRPSTAIGVRTYSPSLSSSRRHSTAGSKNYSPTASKRPSTAGPRFASSSSKVVTTHNRPQSPTKSWDANSYQDLEDDKEDLRNPTSDPAPTPLNSMHPLPRFNGWDSASSLEQNQIVDEEVESPSIDEVEKKNSPQDNIKLPFSADVHKSQDFPEMKPKEDILLLKTKQPSGFDNFDDEEDVLLAERSSYAPSFEDNRANPMNILKAEERLRRLTDAAKEIQSMKEEERKKRGANPEISVKESLQEKWLLARNLGKKKVDFMARKRLLREWFDSLDEDRSGYITCDELMKPLLDSGVVTSKNEFSSLIAPYDKDGNGKLDFEEFVNMLCSTNHDEKSRALWNLMEMHMKGNLGNNELPFSTVVGIFSRQVVLKAVMGDAYSTAEAKLPPRDSVAYQRIHDAWVSKNKLAL